MKPFTPLEQAIAGRFLGEKLPVPLLCMDQHGDILWPAGKEITKTGVRTIARNINRVWVIPSPMSRILSEIRDKFPEHYEMKCEQGSCCGMPCGKVFLARAGIDAVCPECGTRYHACRSALHS